MIAALIGTINLLTGLWWLWVILFGSAFMVMVRAIKPLLAASFLVGGVVAYLALTPLEYLQISTPAYLAPSPPLTASDGGMPKADKLEINFLPAFYEVTNKFFIPLLKQWWYIWIPGWFALLFISSFDPPKQRRHP